MTTSADSENQRRQSLRTYARMTLLFRAALAAGFALLLANLIVQYMASMTILSEISVLGNNGLTNNNFTYLNRLQLYGFLEYLLYFAIYFVVLVVLSAFRNYICNRTIEITGITNYAEIKRIVKQNGGLLKLSFSR